MQLGGRQLSFVCHAITEQNSRTFCQMEAKRVRKQKMHKIRYGEYYARMQIWTNTKPESNSICKYFSGFILLFLYLADGLDLLHQQIRLISYHKIIFFHIFIFIWALQGLVSLKDEVQNQFCSCSDCSSTIQRPFPRSRINFEPQLLSQHEWEVLKVLRKYVNLNIYNSCTGTKGTMRWDCLVSFTLYILI